MSAALIHDVIVAPLAIAVGWVVVRFAPRALKAPLQAALLLSAVLVAVSWPALRGYGRVASNPTYLPRDYGTGRDGRCRWRWCGRAAPSGPSAGSSGVAPASYGHLGGAAGAPRLA